MRPAQSRVVRRVIPVLCLVVVGGWIAGAVAAADTPKLTATVTTVSPTSRLVRIVNRDQVTYRHFIVQSLRTPKIVAATKPCVVQRDGTANGTEFIWRYRATCKKALAPGRALNIRLTTEGRGRINVFVVVKNTSVTITK
jgi:hypothetical protein